MATNKILIRAPQSPERQAAARMTGRYLVTVQPGAHKQVTSKLAKIGFVEPRSIPRAANVAKALPDGGHIPLTNIGVSLLDPKPEQEDKLQSLAAAEDSITSVEPERIVRAVENGVVTDYVRGWRDATEALTGRLIVDRPAHADVQADAVAALPTWGLTATRVIGSRFSGGGIKLAVLDTGFDLNHPDFAQRRIVTKNFVGDQLPFHDGVGHGTHCIGTAAGPLQPGIGSRYGIAYDADIYAARVLDDTGRGGDFNILQGIDWAIQQGCQVISLSLGAPWSPGNPAYSPAYESAAKHAMEAGCLLVVAAGNDADNPQYIGAVGTPGNSPSVLTVAAVDRNLATASFSNRAQPNAPGVKGPDLAGPGVGIYSSWPMPQRYNTINGTSMATPHVAGIAALFAQAHPSVRGQGLKDMLIAQCKALSNGSARRGEIGNGLVQAPDGSVASAAPRRRSRRSA